MSSKVKINDVVIRFANVNGTGSASANELFSKAVFRMGIPLSSKNIFPSNIQGLPTWFEVRINQDGYIARREGIDIMVAVNPQSFDDDVKSVRKGGYLIYDSTKRLHPDKIRGDIHYIGIPMIQLCMDNYEAARSQQLFKNIVYVGALATLLNMDLEVLQLILRENFSKKETLLPPNFLALELGANYIKENYEYPLNLRLEKRDQIKDKILIEGNDAMGLGALYAGATVAAWYPITPSTSVVNSFEKYCNELRMDPDSGKKNFAIIQAEDELAAIGIVIGASWNGARAFTSTSGAGISLMSEFLGLAYFSEVPTVILNVQRGGPSTGMPTRTQQSDLTICGYASHGDTKHVLLFPSTPAECFSQTVQAFDLAEMLQTPVIVMSDLDLGMNYHLSPPLEWSDSYKYNRGKVLDKAGLNKVKNYGRYLDVDGDGICYRTIPGTHPSKGAFVTRGTSRDEYAKYTESSAEYMNNVDRLTRKWDTAKTMMPASEFFQSKNTSKLGVICFGTSIEASEEARDLLKKEKVKVDLMRVKSFPFNKDVGDFIDKHDTVFVVEQNRNGQLRSMLIDELQTNPQKLLSVLHYDGMPITADSIMDKIHALLKTAAEAVA